MECFSSEERHNVRPDVVVEGEGGETGVEHEVDDERASGLRLGIEIDVAALDAEEELGSDGEAGRGEGEAAEGALVAVDAEGGGGEVAGGESGGGGDEEGDDRVRAVVVEDELQGSVAVVTAGCATDARG